MLPIYTVGHSTRTIPEFVQLLRAGGIELIVDIRRIPQSRTNPQYNWDVLPAQLAPVQIAYLRIAELGGRRATSKIVPPATNAFWSNRSFHNYADYALTDEYRIGLEQVLEVAQTRNTAIMCSEAVWWRCHRRIVADYLLQLHRHVYHLMGTARVIPAEMTSAAVARDDGLHYPSIGDS